MLNILIAILIFGILILVHELGHYLSARIFKVKILEFSIGMGPKLFRKTSKKTGIAYSLRLLPIGGFVSMDGEDEESDHENAFTKKPIWQRFIITVSGAVINILLGIIITCVMVISSQQLYTTTISSFDEENATSQLSGLAQGDIVTRIGKKSVHTAYDLAYTIMHEGYRPVDVTVIRNGEKMVIEDVSFPTSNEGGITMGVRDFYVTRENKTFFTVIKHSFYQSVTSIRMIWESLIDLISGRYGVDQMSGPIGVTTAIGDAADQGGANLAYLTALITLNLGIFNLLPLPALDGGRIVFLLIEFVRRKPVKREVEGYINFVGIALLLLLMVFVTYQDILRLFT